MNETTTLAGFLSEDLTFDSLPPDVVQQAKLCIIDTVGVGVGASTRPWSLMAADLIAEDGGFGEATMWGREGRVTASQAALFNGTSAHGIEMDDRVPKAHVHPGCYVVPAAFASAEKTGADGRTLLTGVVAGYELGLRVGYSVHFKPGLHRSGHKGVWPAVGAAVKVLGLDPQQTTDSLGLAGSMASGLMEFSNDPRGTMVKRLHAGFAASNGILAARLGQRGFTGPATVLEGEYGYCTVYSRGGSDPRFDELTRGFGEQYKIMDRELKPYAAWGGGHNAIDAVAQILAKHEVKPADVRSVSIGGSTMLVVGHEMHEPRSIMAAQFSLSWLVAITLCRGAEAFMDPDGLWTDELLDDQQLQDLANRTEVHIDADLDEFSINDRHYGGARVTFTLNDGTELQETVLRSKGTIENPMSTDEVIAKFRAVTQRVLPPAAGEEFIRLVDQLEELPDTRALGEILAPSRQPA